MILSGHVLDKLKELPDKSVHMVVTSPPYYGLRAYGTEAQVWVDGRELCKGEHEWVDNAYVRNNDKTAGKKQRTNVGAVGRDEPIENDFCNTCNAWRGELGSEPTPELFVQHIVEIFREVRRVLRDDGTLWLNFGDSHWGGKGQSAHGDPERHIQRAKEGKTLQKPHSEIGRMGMTLNKDGKHPVIKPLDLIGIPWLVAFALRADGWYLRMDNIWWKRNPMPESVDGWRWERHRVKVEESKRDPNKGNSVQNQGDSRHNPDSAAKWEDCPCCPKCQKNSGLILRKGSWRPTKSHEYVFLLSKTDNYYCDKVAVMQDGVEYEIERRKKEYKKGLNTVHKVQDAPGQSPQSNSGAVKNLKHRQELVMYGKKNLRSVWDITTKPYKGAHFATFPPDLPELCIKAGTSEKGCCPKCGSPWVRVIEKKTNTQERNQAGKNNDTYQRGRVTSRLAPEGDFHDLGSEQKTVGWLPSCECEEKEPVPCTVLDPFGGSGTTGAVALGLGRDAVLIELNEQYVNEHITPRIAEVQKEVKAKKVQLSLNI